MKTSTCERHSTDGSVGFALQILLVLLILFVVMMGKSVQAAAYPYEITPATSIPNPATNVCTYTNINIPVSGNFTITDLNVGLNITHTSRADIDAKLTSPAGTSIFLFTDVGGIGDHFDILLDDSQTSDIGTAISTTNHILASPYYDKLYNPEGTVVLSAFNGQNANGTWVLGICDDASATAGGIVNRIKLDFTGNAIVTTDRGDAPSSYGDPTHTIVAGIRLGAAAPDSEIAAQPSTTATLDDTTGTDDEDGITIPALNKGQSATITATVTGAGGYLQGWIDWNGNGDFTDSGEQIATNLQDNLVGDANAIAGQMDFSVNVPATAVTTATFARFRWSTTSGLSSTAAATNGEVEDYAVTPQVSILANADYGDAPDTANGTAAGNYQTKHSDTGAYHTIIPNLSIGNNVDVDNGTQQNANADADDTTGSPDDEDGLQNPPIIPTTAGQTYTLTTYVKNETGLTAYLTAYLDFNRDGDFLDAGEQADTQHVYWNGYFQSTFTIPTGTTVGVTYARLRLSQTRTEAESSVGAATSGEIEDHKLTLSSGPFYDFGDAPSSYGNPRHTIVNNLFLGTNRPDSETGSHYSYNASGDGVDEDGAPKRYNNPSITLFPILKMTANSYSVDISTINTTGSTGKLYGWIDFDQNGTFDSDEATSVNITNNTNSAVTLLWNSIPIDIKLGTTFIRLRLTTDAAVTTNTPASNAIDGEVEDFPIAVAIDVPPDSTDVTIVRGEDQACSSTIFTDNFDDLASEQYFGANTSVTPFVIRNWTATGGGSDTYARTVEVSPFAVTQGRSIYFGNGMMRRYYPDTGAVLAFDGNGRMLNPPDAIELRDNVDDVSPGVSASESDWGPEPVTLSRTFASTAGQRYRLYFSAIPEGGDWKPGIMRVDTPSGSIHFKAPGLNEGIQKYRIEFTAIGASSTIRFVNYGHIGTDGGYCDPNSIISGAWCTVGGFPTDNKGNELIIDDVAIAVASACPNSGISGTVYTDINGNNTLDTGTESGIANVTVMLYDNNGTTANTNDDSQIATTNSAANGTYSFANISSTPRYRIEVDTRDTDLPTSAAIGTLNPLPDVAVTTGSTVANQNFGFDLACNASAGQFGGIAFRDYNQNGIREPQEEGIANITVTAFNSANAVAATATTDARGWYTLSGLTNGTQYRLEYTSLPSGLYPGAASTGTDTTSTVRFVTASGSCSANLGISDPIEYCQTTPSVAAFNFVNGNPSIAAVGDYASLFTFPYDATGNADHQTPVPISKANTSQTGALWGMAYQKTTKTLYASAAMRRFSGFGALGTGGIYKVDMTDPNAAYTGASTYVDLRTIGIDTGNDGRVAGDSCNTVATGPWSPAYDVAAWDKVGKIGVGDIDYDEPNNRLWLVNLNDRKLYGISNVSPTTTPTAANVLGGYTVNLPSPYTCTSGTFRPWAVKYHRGYVYVGGVCDAASDPYNLSKVRGYVLRFNPANTAAGFSHVKDFAINQPRSGYEYTNIGEWSGWLPQADAVNVRPQFHSPIVGNLEFDTDGSIIVGIIDRAGLQKGTNSYDEPTCADPTVDYVDTMGDVLRLCKTDTGYLSDSEPGCTTAIASNSKTTDEYYWGDLGPTNNAWEGMNEIAAGGLALAPGKEHVLASAYDANSWGSNGVVWLNNRTGAKDNSYHVSWTTFGKSTGMGELEVLCDLAPLEIGNRVWLDTDKDGIQDAGEAGISNANVTLTCGTDTANATTNTQGEYYFSNAPGKNAAFMGSGESCSLSITNSQASLTGYTLTTQNADGKTDNNYQTDIRDSDAAVNTGNAVINFTAGNSGQNNHGLDFGYKSSAVPGTITGTVYRDANKNDVFDSATETGIPNITVSLHDENFTPANTADDTLVNTANTNASGVYTFSNVDSSRTYRITVDTADTDLPAGMTVGTTHPLTSKVVAAGATLANQNVGFDLSSAVIHTPPAYNVCKSTSVEQLDAFQYATATGSGAAGTPSLTYTAPSGSNRMMVVLLSVERDHTPIAGGRGDNFESNVPFSNSWNDAPTVTFGGVPLSKQSFYWDTFGSSTNVSDAEISRSYYLYTLFDLSIPTSAQTLQVTGINAPKNAGDDAILSVATFANVAGIEVASGLNDRQTPFNITIPVSPTPDGEQPPGTSATDNLILAYGSSSKPETVTIGAGWTKLAEIPVSNNAGSYTSDPSRSQSAYTENDGHTLFIQSIKGVSGNQTAQVSSSTTNLSGLGMNLYRLVAHGCDYGDAPASYGDALHSQSWSRRLGAQRGDAETATPTAANANGDDANKLDDEDGVTIPVLTAGQSTTITVNVAGSAYLSGWIDWNGDGDFADAGEKIATDMQDSDADGLITLSVNVPATATPNQTYARFRWAINTGTGATGFSSYGEVEDYAITITSGESLSISGKVWFDTNNDGIQNDGAIAYIEGAKVELYNPATSSIVATTTTNANGEYQFTSTNGMQAATNYQLRLQKLDTQTPLSNWSLAALNAGSDYTLDSDASLSGNYWVINVTSPTSGNTASGYGFGFINTVLTGCLDVGSSGVSDESMVNSHPNAYDFLFGGKTATGYCTEKADQDPLAGDNYVVNASDRQSLTVLKKEKLSRGYSALTDPDIIFQIAAVFDTGNNQRRLDDLMTYMTWFHTHWNESLASMDAQIDSNSNYSAAQQAAMKSIARVVIDRINGANAQIQYQPQNIFWLWNMTSTNRQDIIVPAIYAAGSSCATGKAISGKVFEDKNYGGGAGRTISTTGIAGILGVRVELYNSTGAFVTSTTTTDGGPYSFSNVAAGNYYVRVVNDTIRSTRAGSTGAERAIQTHRTDGTTAVNNEVGGRKPALVDAAANTTNQTLNPTTFVLSGGGQAQSVQPITMASSDITGANFGFNFSTVVNTNDSGQGSLRQTITNINLLANTGLAQTGQDNTYGINPSVIKEVLLFNIPAASDSLGRADICGGATCKITISSQLPAVANQPAIIDATTQPGYVAGTPGVPRIQIVPTAGLDARGFTMNYDAPDSTFRGFAITGFRNLNTNRALTVDSERTLIESNYIGVKPDGTADGNSNGIELQYTQTAVIGGATAAKRNIISGNKFIGIFFNTGASGSTIQNNFIGTNPAGTAAMSNETIGIDTEGGSGTKILDNVISGNWGDGIQLGFTSGGPGVANAIIQGNRIGVGINGEPIGNNGPGIMNYGASNGHQIGGTGAGQGNIIAHNLTGGIKMANNSSSGIVISGNSIYANGNLGIDLGNNGVTINDTNDADTGANNLLNFPLLADLSIASGNLTVKGCAPAGSTVELFEADVSTGGKATLGDNKVGKSKDYGEGQIYLASFVEGSASDTDAANCSLATDADGNNQTGMKAFSVIIPAPAGLIEADLLTTTATVASVGTSEFSPVYTYNTACKLVVTTTGDTDTPANNSGSLRDAIECANATPEADTITFNIPNTQPGYTNPDSIANNGDEYWSIQPTTPLPSITKPLVLDGSTQPSTTCPKPRVEIDGSLAGADADGIGLYASNSTIKGLIINDFSRYGVKLSRFPINFPSSNTLQTNNILQCSYVGVSANGLTAKPNLQGGIAAEGDSMKIGGTTIESRNVISGNGAFGIYFAGGGSTNGTVQGNYIGVGADGTTTLGNNGFGIGYYNTDGGGLIGGTAGVTINGACTGTCNIIAHNTNAGIGFFYTGPAGRNVRISGNAIHSNGGIGIDLERSSDPWVLDGVNPNDTGDSDSAYAPNGLQNYPVLNYAKLSGVTTDISGTLNSIANATFTLEFFANTSADPTGYGEGERYLGNTTVTTNSSGNATFTVSLPAVAAGTYITSTATDATNNTSEFSSAIVAAVLRDIGGKIYEDVNYGGGNGRAFDAAIAGMTGISGATVELRDTGNTLLATVTTAADGSYTFPSVPVGTYSVQVVNTSVRSTRPGANGSERGVITYRTDGVGNTVNAADTTFSQTITLDTTALSNVSFGFNFDTVTNANDSGAGSLRQFILNANLLSGDSTLAQTGRTAGKENAILMLSTTGANYHTTDKYWSIPLQSALPALTSPLVLDSSTQPGFDKNPTLELKGTTAGAGVNGLTVNASGGGSTLRKLAINGFGGAGIYLNGSNGNTLEANHLGADPKGIARSNMGAGLLMDSASNNMIGGTANGVGNVLANNVGAGIAIVGNTSLDNSLLGNSIYNNEGIGIDLGNNGVTANDHHTDPKLAGDADAGPNDLLNFPEAKVNSFGANGTKIVTYDFDLDVAAGDYRLEFFASTTKDPAGNGEGEIFIGAKDISHLGKGSVNFKGTLNANMTLLQGTFISTTLTKKTGGSNFGATSEFSGVQAGIPTQVCDSLIATGSTGSDMVIDETNPTTVIKLLEAWDYSTTPKTPITYVISGGADGNLFTVENPAAGATLPCAKIKFITSDVVVTKSATTETRGIVTPGYTPPAGNYELPMDAGKDNVYNFQVTGTTASGKKYVRDIRVRVLDTNESPVITSAASVSFNEDTTANVVDIAAQDPDVGTAEGKGLTYRINGGADAAQFTVDAASGVLRFRAAPDYDAPMDTNRDNVYEVEVTVTDAGGLSGNKLFTVTVTNNTADDGVVLNARAMLQGVYDSSTALMSADLNTLGLLPTKQPYAGAPFNHAGTETVSAMLQETTGNNAIVDWTLVDLRSSPSSIVASRAVMLQRDGDLVDAQTGSANLHFAKVKAGNYYISVRHRNHLGVISASPVSLNNTAKLVNFADSTATVKGEASRLVAGKLAMLWAGDINGSNTLTANGPGNDVTSLLSGVISNADNVQGNTNHILSGYLTTDLNMDGKTLFTGPGNDTSLLVGNILLHPLNTGFAANYIVKGGLQ